VLELVTLTELAHGFSPKYRYLAYRRQCRPSCALCRLKRCMVDSRYAVPPGPRIG
jgi:hypothetical protein